MSEEKPTFKVTDRRLFNPDGTPREGVKREAEPTPPPPPPAQAAGGEAAPARAEQEAARAESGGGAEAARERADKPAETSQEFLMLVEFVASFAADAMGMVTHPGAPAPADVNLPLARQCIEMLAALRQKTDGGRLSSEEQRFLDSILSQLRMQYVSLNSAPQAAQPPPRGFSGSDITGGR